MTDLDLSDRQREFLGLLPATLREAADEMDVAYTTVEGYKEALQGHGLPLDYRVDGRRYEWFLDDEAVADGGETDDVADLPDLSDVDVEGEPDESDLTNREEYIVRELQTGTTVDDLADELDERETVVTQHLRDLKASGWQVYVDETAEMVAIEGDHTLRSSEHTGTRTRKANRWWEQRHNGLVREFRALETPTAEQTATEGAEDWVLHLTDVHAGDRVRTPDKTNVYNADVVPEIVRYITRKSLELADYHDADYDTAHLLWGGDFITNEGIYEGQFESLDAWLDEQHDMLAAPLLEMLKAYADRFETVNVVTQVGNHGEHRASGTSKQANADLILYKNIRNTVAAVQEYGDGEVFDNVNFHVGEGRAYVNFALRDGRVRGHLRHGQSRRPQAETSARRSEWTNTLLNHEFDLAWMGHHHVSGKIPWDGPPVIVSGSPKPPSDFVERIAASTALDPRDAAREIAHCHGVADHGLTGLYPVKTHDFDYLHP